jgi:glutamate/aspartate transport system substrate-binding protein
MMLKAVDAIKAELKLAKLDVKLVPVTSENRITLVQNGAVDLECGSTTNTTERQKQVSFLEQHLRRRHRLITKANSGIKDFPDLAGKTVVTTAGTTSERLLRKMNEDNNMKMKIISAKDHGEAFLTLESGRAAAFVMDEVLLYGELAKAKNASEWAWSVRRSRMKPMAA